MREGYISIVMRTSQPAGSKGLEDGEVVELWPVYPKPKLSQPGEGHRIYTYLLGGTTVERVNQVAST
jgi:hypothetical protein